MHKLTIVVENEFIIRMKVYRWLYMSTILLFRTLSISQLIR